MGFFADGKLKKIRASSGPVQVVTEGVPDPRGGSWGPNDIIIFGTGTGSIYRVPSGGGMATPVTNMDDSGQVASHRWPHFLPDAQHFLLDVRSELVDRRGVYVGSLDGATPRLLLRSDSNALYLSPGYLLFLEGDTLLGQAFDAERLELRGQSFLIAGRVGRASNGYGAVSTSLSGTLAYGRTNLPSGLLTWFDRRGTPLGSVGPEGDYTDFRLSPDEKRLAASLVDPTTGNPDVWLTELLRGSPSRFTFGPGLNTGSVWSPDGERLVFRTTRRGGQVEFFEKSSGGGGNEASVLLSNAQRAAGGQSLNLYTSDWSHDGRNLLYCVTASSGSELWLLPMADRKPVRLLRVSSIVAHASFSPDGRLVTYASDESGKLEVYVQTLPLSDRKWQVSTSGGSEPRWRRDGLEIYYLSPDRKLMAASVNRGPSFDAPTPLFQTNVAVRLRGSGRTMSPVVTDSAS